jgi:outer membrane protein assembly factor BamD
MRLFHKLLFLLSFLLLQSCSKDVIEKSTIKENNQELEMISAYTEAFENLEKGDTFYAAEKFLEAELLLPQSEWAPKSALMAAYAYYLQNYYSKTIFHLDRYLKTYPDNKNNVYAHYLLGMSHYESIENEKKDLAPLLNAKKKFSFIVKNYPNTGFDMDSKFKINLINDILASKEMYLALHYVKKEKWIPAINRFKVILKEYDTTIYAEEAIHRLVEIHYHIGLVNESKKYASLLGYNYRSGEWYEKSYKIFNQNYKSVKTPIKKKEKKALIKKFRNLFK